ncbi:MAG: hypothetical protein AABW48_04170 [Nanoarchaeota archaeon]|mgnify:CR=1 FL=1
MKTNKLVPAFNRAFAETLLDYYPRGTEEERALAAAEMYGKKAEMEVALQQRKKERGLFGVFRSSGKSLIEVLEEVCQPESILGWELTLDEQAADDGKKKTPNEWFDYWSNITDGRVMASMGDLYHSFKIIKKMHEQGTEQEHAKAKSLLFSLRDDCDWTGKQNWLISSTRLFYSGTSLDARIIQHYRCPRPELVKETIVEVPVYRGTPLKTIVNEQQGLAYLQALFDTEDDAKTILQTLEFVSGKRGDSLVSWTANTTTKDTQYTRASHPQRAAGFEIYGNQFRVVGSNFKNDLGCSRGVRL